ncbi:hypothetical protein IQ255_10400 [Pleurocapsales cyanobacterium LEGE 10410]|nr:hypothetical protein [Pleurocapsales cyanobacterium LEGE 10410]
MLGRMKAALLVPFTLLLWGCETDEDLKAVREFVNMASSGTEIFAAISGDFYGSCLRRARHPSLNAVTTEPQLNNWLLQRNSESTEFKFTSEPQTFAQWREQQEQQCQVLFGDLETQLNQPNQLMADYIQKLGELADGEVSNYSNNFNNLKGSLNNFSQSLQKFPKTKLSGFKPTHTMGAVSILEFLVEAGNRDFQREQLIEVISQTDNHLQQLIAGLSTITEEDYHSLLDLEAQQLDRYYQDPILRELNRLEETKSPEADRRGNLPLTAVLVDSQWRAEKSKIDRRRKQAEAYVQVITEIGKTHSELKNRLLDRPITSTPEEFNQLITESTQTLKPLVNEAIQITQQLSGEQHGNSNNR